MQVADYLDELDALYAHAKKVRWSRFSVEWGKPSRSLNLRLRGKLKQTVGKKNMQWKYAFYYWVTISQLLELHYKRKLFGGAAKKRLTRQAKHLRQLALDPDVKIDDGLDLKRVLMESVRKK